MTHARMGYYTDHASTYKEILMEFLTVGAKQSNKVSHVNSSITIGTLIMSNVPPKHVRLEFCQIERPR